MKLLRNPGNRGTYYAALAAQTFAILVVVFLAMQLCVDTIIAGVFLLMSAARIRGSSKQLR